MKPLLSICIPTLNRCDLLSVLLENLKQQVSHNLEKVEIVVADNASTDATEKIIKMSSLPIIYAKQEKTVGFTRNVLFATTKLASGEFIWVLGDDDLLLPGGLENVLDSIARTPKVNYHYLNFGWIDYKQRQKVIQEFGGHPPQEWLNHLQFSEPSWKYLHRLEDLAFLPSDNISAAFSGIFCFVTRRQYYIDAIDILHPSDSLDGSSTLIDDCFPHAKLSLPRVSGQPITYTGSPCLMQGISGWEWGAYAYKNMVFGTYQFFEWLEETSFAKDALSHLWSSFYHMAGRLFFRMLYYKNEHKGLEIVLDKAVPASARNPIFWEAFMEEAKLNFDTDHDAKNMSQWVSELVAENPLAKIGIWGVMARGHQFVKFSQHLINNLVWVADKDTTIQGTPLDGTQLLISHPASLSDVDLDILVIGTRKDFVPEIIKTASTNLKAGTLIVSVKGQIKLDKTSM